MRALLAPAFGALLACTAAFGADPAPAPAVTQPPVFTPAQREAIVQILHQALTADPSILRDAITALQADEEKQEKARIRALSADTTDPTAGNPAGDVTVVEFYDPRCPYCRSVHQTVENLLQGDHGIRLLFKDIPVLGPASDLASRAILAARNQGAYLKMQTALMGDPAQPSLDGIRKTAASLGLDANRLVADMDAPAIRQQIDANLHLARQLHVQGTPVFFIGDQSIPGAVDQAQLESAVIEARKHPT
jgi:protein-disulfide isomerase